jgi:formylglycine-generating enzyme required for sulfatase activity
MRRLTSLILIPLSMVIWPVQASGPLIDRTEVSNADYAIFLYWHPQRKRPKYWDEYRPAHFIRSPAVKLAPFKRDTFTKPDHPVVGVSWFDARDYCQWRGRRLPSHAEWRWAAGGDDGRIWPWGSAWDYKKANSGGERNGEHDGYTYSAPVTAFAAGASPLGALNMAGNVAEWVEEQSVAGGSSNSSPSGVAIQSAVKREPEYRTFDIGFRCIAR